MSEIGEKEAVSRFIEGMRQAEGAARILGHYRTDEQWIFVAGLIGKILEKATVLAMRGVVS